MVRKFFLLILMFTSGIVTAQKESFSSNGLIRANLAFNQSFMVQHKNKNVYLGGFLEYYTSKSLSFRGDCLWYIDSRQQDPLFKQNYTVLFGSVLHLPKGRSDFQTGVQPGFVISQPVNKANPDLSNPLRVNAALSLMLGYTLYFSRFCNFSLAANYIISNYRGSKSGNIRTDEFLISGGLGFHIQTKRQITGK